MSVAALDFITLEEKQWGRVDRVPLSVRKMKINGHKATPTQQKLLGCLHTFAPMKEDEGKQKSCQLTWKVKERFGSSLRRVTAAKKELEELEVIKAVDRKASGIRYALNVPSKGRLYDVVPLYLYTAQVKAGDGFRRVRPSEVSVWAHVMTLCLPKKLLTYCMNADYSFAQKEEALDKTEFKCACTVKSMAESLNLNENTVYRALKVAEEQGLILVTYGQNRYKNKCRFTVVAKWLYSYLLYLKTKKQKPSEIAAADYATDRTRFYARRKQEAEDKADKNRERARRNARFVKLDKELRDLVVPMARASIDDPQKYKELQQEERALKADYLDVLAEMGLREVDLQPKYHCKACNDSGVRNEDGKPCGCYVLYRRRE